MNFFASLQFSHVQGLLRHGLTTAGGFLTSSGIANADQVTGLVGALMAVLGVLWSMMAGEKVSNLGAKLEGLFRHVITIAGGALVQRGLVNPDTVAQLAPLAITLVGFGLSALDRSKVTE